MSESLKMRSLLLLLAGLGLLFLVATSASAALGTLPDEGTIQTNGRVKTILVAGDRIYLGGFFTQVDGLSRNRLAAIDATTGELTNWNPNANGSVRALALSQEGTRIYAGGAFTSIGGTYRGRLAAIDAATGALDTAWKPGTVNSTVRAISVSGNHLYIGGDFTTVRAQSRPHLALIDGTTGSLDPNWTPDAYGRVRTLDLSEDGTRVYAGGPFTAISGQERPYLAALDSTSGALDDAFAPPSSNGRVFDVEVSGGRLYTAEGGPGGAVASYDAATGERDWSVQGDGDAETVAVWGEKVYLGGHFLELAGEPRRQLAALDAATGALDPEWAPRAGRGDADCTAWNPSTCGSDVWALAADPLQGRLYTGGDFRRISGEPHAGFARFSEQEACTISGTPNSDTLEGTPDADVICGLGGADTIKGLGGYDILRGDDGDDTLLGGADDDAIDGGRGSDTISFENSSIGVSASLLTKSATGEGTDTFASIEHLIGSTHPDELTGSDGDNRLLGKGAEDQINGQGGGDKLWGGAGDDTLRGGSGVDKVVGDSGADNLFGDDGDDTLNSQDGISGNDSLDGGEGTDACTMDPAEASVTNCEG